MILTLTTNPALDVATETASVVPTAKLRCSAPSVGAGGGGINVARVLSRFGVPAIAVYAKGGLIGERIAGALAAEGQAARAVTIAGESRHSFTVTDRTTHDQYRFVLPGPTLTDDDAARLLTAVADEPGAVEVVVHSGSLPTGLEAGFLAALARVAAGRGARLVVDGPGEVLRGCRGAFLVKPNAAELEAYAGRPLNGLPAIAAAAREMIAEEVAENVLVSLGADGALLVGPTSAHHFGAPSVELVSAIGAGDSMVAGLLAGLMRGDSLVEAAALGTAAGAAAILTPNTELCRIEDVNRLRPEVTITAVEVAPAPVA